MPDKFKELIRNIKNGDKNSVLSIKKNIETIVTHHFSKKKIELEWIANNKRIFCFEELVNNLFDIFIDELKKESNTINQFIDYKEFIIKNSEAQIKLLFDNFYELLKENDTKAWLIFNKSLKFRIKVWLIKKGIHEMDLIETLYQDAQTIFIEKREKEKLYFENSRYIKSYFFKIIHFKLFEHFREKKDKLSIDDYENSLDDADNSGHLLNNLDKKELNQQLFNQLNELERAILTEVFFNGEKLKVIAQKFNITESNCRVTKYRALSKLEGRAKKLGYY